jgi:hypothetical protein
VLGREVIKGQQYVELVGDLGRCLWELGQAVGERFSGLEGFGASAGVVDGLNSRFGLRLKAFW